jgi:hypothetical protein
MGPRSGTAAALALASREIQSPVRRTLLRRRPLRITGPELGRALGGDPATILRGVTLAALPTVARFEHQLDSMEAAAKAALLDRAEVVALHSFELLGSGPTQLGAQIDWSADFKTGRRWPLQHLSRLPIVLGGGSDIKVPWELSRCQHLPLLAAAYRLTADARWLDEIASQIESWIEANPVEFGPNWACTMDVAIRASNWVATLVMIANNAVDRPWFDRALASLLLHGRFIRSHLEWAEVRGNHYLSDVAGLLVVSAAFQGCEEGRGWADFATQELAAELEHQVRADGCDHEASIPYHRLVAELLICGTQAADALRPARIGDAQRERLERMLSFTADYTRPDGLAPQVGDADDGRFLPLGDYGADPRSHLHLFVQAGRTYRGGHGHAAYPNGGYWIMRAGDLFVLVRCGDVGIGGLGSHAHNDALSFELTFGDQPLVIDPGSYLYTADPAARNQFRSTAFHSTLQIDGAEQNPLSEDALFAMPDRRRAEALVWSADSAQPSFEGRHHGYEILRQPATHTRRLELDVATRTLRITDRVDSLGEHRLGWTFALAPCRAEASGSTAIARFASGVRLEIEASGVDMYIDDGWMSPSYGRRVAVPFVRGRKHSKGGTDTTQFVLRTL